MLISLYIIGRRIDEKFVSSSLDFIAKYVIIPETFRLRLKTNIKRGVEQKFQKRDLGQH